MCDVTAFALDDLTRSGRPGVPWRSVFVHRPKHALVVVDTADFPLVSGNRWCLSTWGYPRRNRNGKHEAMHRVVLGVTDRRVQTDHINGNRLDNRRANLRLASNAENAQNRHRPFGSSRFRGVDFDADRGKWRAQATVDYRNHFLGRYATEAEAAEVAARFRAAHMPFSTN